METILCLGTVNNCLEDIRHEVLGESKAVEQG